MSGIHKKKRNDSGRNLGNVQGIILSHGLNRELKVQINKVMVKTKIKNSFWINQSQSQNQNQNRDPNLNPSQTQRRIKSRSRRNCNSRRVPWAKNKAVWIEKKLNKCKGN